MTKLKSPLLSLGARGTIADSVTFQERNQGTFVRKKPIPAYRRSLLQVYQRWLYEDYAYLWTQASVATKQEYASASSRFHLTGFQYWMKYHLKNMPDILAWWRLDNTLASIAYDASPFAWNGVIVGASPATLAIDGALKFDGLNDRINLGVPPHLANFTQRSLVLFFKAPAFIGTGRSITWFNYTPPFWGERIILVPASNHINAGLWNNLGIGGGSQEPFTPNTLHCFIYTWDGTWITTYLDGVNTAAPVAVAGTVSCAGPLYIGVVPVATYFYDGYLDNIMYLNRVLDITEIKRWSERRYPS